MKRRVGSITENLEPRVVLSVSTIPREVVETRHDDELATDTQPADSESFEVATSSGSSLPKDIDVDLDLDQQTTDTVADSQRSQSASNTTEEDKHDNRLILTEPTNNKVSDNRVTLDPSESNKQTNDTLTNDKRQSLIRTTRVVVNSHPDSIVVSDEAESSADRVEERVSEDFRDDTVSSTTDELHRATANDELRDAADDLAEDASSDLPARVDANDQPNSKVVDHRNDLLCDHRTLLDDCNSTTEKQPGNAIQTDEVSVEESEIAASSDGWLDAISLSMASWASVPARTSDPLLGYVGLPAVTMASAISMLALSRKSVSDADRPKFDSAADWIAQLDRRWWRERQRGNNAQDRTRREAAKKQRQRVQSVESIDLSTPEISDSFVMALMAPIDPGAFQMDLIESNDQDSLNASMIAATCGAVAFGATKALSKGKRKLAGASTAHSISNPGTTLVRGSD
jgi:hypothetical protein